MQMALTRPLDTDTDDPVNVELIALPRGRTPSRVGSRRIKEESADAAMWLLVGR